MGHEILERRSSMSNALRPDLNKDDGEPRRLSGDRAERPLRRVPHAAQSGVRPQPEQAPER
ncbi:hypothetical protein M8494_11740 [Serratia ureilytica]